MCNKRSRTNTHCERWFFFRSFPNQPQVRSGFLPSSCSSSVVLHVSHRFFILFIVSWLVISLDQFRKNFCWKSWILWLEGTELEWPETICSSVVEKAEEMVDRQYCPASASILGHVFTEPLAINKRTVWENDSPTNSLHLLVQRVGWFVH